jgi:hypothetical protein
VLGTATVLDAKSRRLTHRRQTGEAIGCEERAVGVGGGGKRPCKVSIGVDGRANVKAGPKNGGDPLANKV